MEEREAAFGRPLPPRDERVELRVLLQVGVGRPEGAVDPVGAAGHQERLPEPCGAGRLMVNGRLGDEAESTDRSLAVSPSAATTWDTVQPARSSAASTRWTGVDELASVWLPRRTVAPQ